MSEKRPTEADVQAALSDFKDPELGRSINQLQQVHDVKLEGDRLSLTLALTSFAAPLWEQTRRQLVDHLRSRVPSLEQIDVKLVEHRRPAEKVGQLGLAAKSVIAVGSGKGGVGKSTVAGWLAFGLARAGCKTGLLDADVYGPSIPQLIGAHQQPKIVDNKAQPVVVDGVKVMSMGFLIPEGEAVIWRGPMLHSAITQFLRDTEWGDLDYLIIDMPPGTGDVPLSLSQLLPLTGSVVVCTPQDVALLDATKAIAMFRKVNIEVLGMIENMSFFICPDCGSRHEIFGSGGARKRAEQLGVPFLGGVPIHIETRVRGDEGTLPASFDDEQVAPHLEAICLALVKNLVEKRLAKPPMPSLSVLS